MPNDPSTSTSRAPRPTNRSLFNTKRLSLLSDLILTLDLLIYAQLTVIYHRDVSFLRLLLRCMLQFTFLTPKPSMIPNPPRSPPNRPVILILFSTFLCAAIHAYWPAPEGGEATRGYLHGGLAMDFIGEKGGASRVGLVGADLLVGIMQVLCLGAVEIRKRAKEGIGGTQTVEFEERGELARENTEGDVEMRELNGRGERERLLATESEPEAGRADRLIADAFGSGEIVVADLCLGRILRQQLNAAPDEAGSITGTSTDIEAGEGTSTAGGLAARIAGRIRARAGGGG